MQINLGNLIKKYPYFIAIIVIAIFLRIIKFQEYSMFGHDSSRDVILTYKMFTLGEIIYRGPVFSVIWGDMSPIFYYLLAPFHYIFGFHPLSSSIFSNLLSIITVIFATFTSYKFFGKIAAYITAILFASSALIITNASSALNPSLVPIFAVGLYYFLSKFFIDDQNGEQKENKVDNKGWTLKRIKYKSLIGVSICLSFILALHMSGAFFIPLLFVIYILKRPKADKWSVLVALGCFALFFILPFLIQEKKTAWWTVKQIIKYFENREESNVMLLAKVTNFFDSVFKNTSLLMFGKIVQGYTFYTLPIYLILLVNFVKSIINFKKLTYSSFLAFILGFYLITFMFAVPFEEGDMNRLWFGANFIPLIAIYIAYLLSKISNRKFYYIGFFVLSVFALNNLRTIYEFKGSSDSYFHKVEVAQFLSKDSNGADFDIYGENPQPLYYTLWFNEKDAARKEEYRKWFVWTKSKKANLMYLITSDVENSDSIKKYTTKEEVYVSSLGYKIVKFTK